MKSYALSKRQRMGFVFFALLLILILNTLSAMAATANTVKPQTTPVTTQETQVVVPLVYSATSIWIVLALLVLLGLVFGLMFVWAQKFDQASYLGTLYQATIQDVEFKRLGSELIDKLEKGEYHREVIEDEDWIKAHPIPEPAKILGDDAELLSNDLLSQYESLDSMGTRLQQLGYLESSQARQSKSYDEDQQAAYEAYSARRRQWKLEVAREAKRRHRLDSEKARSEAKQRARRAVNFDLSVLRGRSAEFVLQFSTVVIIIFAVLVLGVLNILQSQAISTLLAAIIGYVLGQATARARSRGEEVASGKADGQSSEPPPA